MIVIYINVRRHGTQGKEGKLLRNEKFKWIESEASEEVESIKKSGDHNVTCTSWQRRHI